MSLNINLPEGMASSGAGKGKGKGHDTPVTLGAGGPGGAPMARPGGRGGNVRGGGVGAGRKSEAAAAAAATIGIGAVPDLGESGPNNIIPGTRIFAKYRDGTERKAVVIENRKVTDETTGQQKWKYYIHYHDFNRRMDCWVDESDVRYDAAGDEAAKREAKAKAEKSKAASSGMDVDGGEGHGHGHGGDDASGEQVVDTDGTVLRFHKRTGAASSSSSAGAGGAAAGAGAGDVVVEFVEPDHEGDGMSEQALREHEGVTKVKNVNYLQMGAYKMECWYFSPLPKEYWVDGFIDILYVCEYCLKFFKRKPDMVHHCVHKCGTMKHPPGDEIYRSADGKISFWELDGAKEKIYCQNLCYLAKLFLDHKTLYYDVDVFLFYVLTERDEYGYHVTGYFSKEKYTEIGYNLACILTFPPHQKKGFGRLLIQFSYELSKIEKRVGSPEKPLSDLGLLSYHSYWSWQILGVIKDALEKETKEISLYDLVEKTSIKTDDIVSTLTQLGFLRYSTGQHVIVAPYEAVNKEFTRLNSKPGPTIDPSRIHWSPYPITLRKGAVDVSCRMSRWVQQGGHFSSLEYQPFIVLFLFFSISFTTCRSGLSSIIARATPSRP
jgi:histone acetyltransferase MYST1